MSAWVAALAVGVAVACLVRSPGRGLGRLRAEPDDPPARRARGPSPALVAATAALLLVAAATVAGSLGVAAGLVASIVGGTSVTLGRRQAARSRRRDRRAEVVRGGEILAGLLRIGQVPTTALVTAAAECPALAEAASLQDFGGDPGRALLDAAEEPGREGLAEIGRAWTVAQRTGASMGDSIAAVAERLADDQHVIQTVAAELAAPRASGRLMGVLPLIGLGVGYLTGGDPVRFLSGSLPGQVCLVLGVGLACLGIWWTDTVADRAGGGA